MYAYESIFQFQVARAYANSFKSFARVKEVTSTTKDLYLFKSVATFALFTSSVGRRESPRGL